MKTFLAFLKKELQESVRRKRVLILGIVFVALGILSPLMAWVTPILFDLFSAALEESGMTITAITVDASTSWVQFFGNIPVALIALFFIYCGSFTKEYSSGTIILVLTKGLSRFKVVLAKCAVMMGLWTAGYWICFLITYVANEMLWDNSVCASIASPVINWWLFGLFVISIVVLFSAIARGYAGVMLGAGGVIFGFIILSIIPKVNEFLPTALMNYTNLLIGLESPADYVAPVLITVALSIGCVIAAIPLFNKKQL